MSISIRFNVRENRDFVRTLTKRVNEYFRTNNRTQHANTEMVLKTITFNLLYFGPFVAMLIFPVPGWAMLLACFVMGVGISGIGMGVMHDANHGAYSGKAGINKTIGYILNAVGGAKHNWIIQHNLLHHTYTNVPEVDYDIEGGGVIRLNHVKKLRGIYKFQHIYAWLLYGLMTLTWVTFKDFKQLVMFEKMGLKTSSDQNLRREWVVMIASKIVYYSYVLVLPMLLMDITIWQWLLGFTIVHVTAGVIMSVVFQLAHVVENIPQPQPDAEGNLSSAWAVHQMETTANFAKKNRFINFMVGGLNYQVEHHLFPHICHVHYPKIAPIVKATAEEFNVPYNEFPTMRSAIKSHYMMLKQLGRTA